MSPNVTCLKIEFDAECIAQLLLPAPTDENVIMYQLKQFNNIIFRNMQSDRMNAEHQTSDCMHASVHMFIHVYMKIISQPEVVKGVLEQSASSLFDVCFI